MTIFTTTKSVAVCLYIHHRLLLAFIFSYKTDVLSKFHTNWPSRENRITIFMGKNTYIILFKKDNKLTLEKLKKCENARTSFYYRF